MYYAYYFQQHVKSCLYAYRSFLHTVTCIQSVLLTSVLVMCLVLLLTSLAPHSHNNGIYSNIPNLRIALLVVTYTLYFHRH